MTKNNEFLCFSSITPIVQIVRVERGDSLDQGHVLPTSLSLLEPGESRQEYGIWSLRFTGDGREILAGGSNSCAMFYDIDRKKIVERLETHVDDVNSGIIGSYLKRLLMAMGF